jgi:uncharacterized protein with GYD domain
MPVYITLMNLTEQGIKNIKEAPERAKQGIEGFEQMGGKIHGFYLTLGEYDYVAVGEAPSDEAFATFMLSLGALGNVRTTTLKGFTTDEFAELVKKMP